MRLAADLHNLALRPSLDANLSQSFKSRPLYFTLNEELGRKSGLNFIDKKDLEHVK